MEQIAVQNLQAAGWRQLGPDRWIDPVNGRNATYAQAMLVQADRPHSGLALTPDQLRTLRAEELHLALDEYGRFFIEQVASVTGINLLTLPHDISDGDLITAILDFEREQRQDSAPVVYLETRGAAVWEFEAAIVDRNLGTITGSGGGMTSRDLHVEVDDGPAALAAFRALADELGVTLDRLMLVESEG